MSDLLSKIDLAGGRQYVEILLQYTFSKGEVLDEGEFFDLVRTRISPEIEGSIMSSAQKFEQRGTPDNIVALLDVDDTVTKGTSFLSDAGLTKTEDEPWESFYIRHCKVDTELLDSLMANDITDLYLFTHMGGEPVRVAERSLLKMFLKMRGFTVHGVATPADVFYESTIATKVASSEEYKLCLMSALKNDDRNQAEPGKIYLDEQGKYYVRDWKQHTVVHEGHLQGIDMTEFHNNLERPSFRIKVLDFIFREGHTQSEAEFEKYLKKIEGIQDKTVDCDSHQRNQRYETLAKGMGTAPCVIGKMVQDVAALTIIKTTSAAEEEKGDVTENLNDITMDSHQKISREDFCKAAEKLFCAGDNRKITSSNPEQARKCLKRAEISNAAACSVITAAPLNKGKDILLQKMSERLNEFSGILYVDDNNAETKVIADCYSKYCGIQKPIAIVDAKHYITPNKAANIDFSKDSTKDAMQHAADHARGSGNKVYHVDQNELARFQSLHDIEGKVIALLDVDGTLLLGNMIVNCEDKKPDNQSWTDWYIKICNINMGLLYSLKKEGLTDIYLFTSMEAGIAETADRQLLVMFLKMQGFTVHGIATPADVFYSSPNTDHQEEKYAEESTAAGRLVIGKMATEAADLIHITVENADGRKLVPLSAITYPAASACTTHLMSELPEGNLLNAAEGALYLGPNGYVSKHMGKIHQGEYGNDGPLPDYDANPKEFFRKAQQMALEYASVRGHIASSYFPVTPEDFETAVAELAGSVTLGKISRLRYKNKKDEIRAEEISRKAEDSAKKADMQSIEKYGGPAWYSSILRLSAPPEENDIGSPDTIRIYKELDKVTVYWSEYGRTCHTILGAGKIADIADRLPEINGSSYDPGLIRDITSRCQCPSQAAMPKTLLLEAMAPTLAGCAGIVYVDDAFHQTAHIVKHYLVANAPGDQTPLPPLPPIAIIDVKHYIKPMEIRTVNFQEGTAQFSIQRSMEFMEYLVSGYDIYLISELPDGDRNNAVLGKIYLDEQGKYYVRDLRNHTVIHEGHLQGIDINNLREKLAKSEFRKQILEFTLKEGHTYASGSGVLHIDRHYDRKIKQNRHIIPRINRWMGDKKQKAGILPETAQLNMPRPDQSKKATITRGEVEKRFWPLKEAVRILREKNGAISLREAMTRVWKYNTLYGKKDSFEELCAHQSTMGQWREDYLRPLFRHIDNDTKTGLSNTYRLLIDMIVMDESCPVHSAISFIEEIRNGNVKLSDQEQAVHICMKTVLDHAERPEDTDKAAKWKKAEQAFYEKMMDVISQPDRNNKLAVIAHSPEYQSFAKLSSTHSDAAHNMILNLCPKANQPGKKQKLSISKEEQDFIDNFSNCGEAGKVAAGSVTYFFTYRADETKTSSNQKIEKDFYKKIYDALSSSAIHDLAKNIASSQECAEFIKISAVHKNAVNSLIMDLKGVEGLEQKNLELGQGTCEIRHKKM